MMYRSGDLALRAFVDPPSGGEKKRPAVVFLHGGFAFGDGDWEMAQPYRDAGYVVMMPVLRGENNQRGVFTLFYDEVEDVLGAADALARLDYVDENRIFVAGHSAGGTLAILAVMASDRFKAAASLSGAMDQTINAEEDPQLCPFDINDEQEIAMRSPLAFATSFKSPARLYYGSRERWAFEMTEGTARAAKAKGLDVAAERVSGDHFTSVPRGIARSISFFANFHPVGDEPKPIRVDDPIVTRSPRNPPRFDFPTIPRPTISRPTIPRPTAPTLPGIGRNAGVVVFEITSYEGRSPARSAALRALIRFRWINLGGMTVDTQQNEIVVRIRGSSVDTGAAKAALENNGFKIGKTEYKPNGR